MSDSKYPKSPGYYPENERGFVSPKELEEVGTVYQHFYKWKAYRSGLIEQFRNYSFEDMLIASRQLFWNSLTTPSTDLHDLGLDFSIPFARKEAMDHLAGITSLNSKGKFSGDELDSLGFRVLNGLYTHWRFHNNSKVEDFWEALYGIVNGTVCSYVGFNDTKLQRRYLKEYDRDAGTFRIESREETYWNDVSKEIVPIEDIYLPKIYERNIQKQGRIIWKTQMDEFDFHVMYDDVYPNAKYVVAGNRLAEDSLYYRLLGGSGTSAYDKVEILSEYDWETDKFIRCAGGQLLNHLGPSSNPTIEPMPFDHKMGPFTWGIMSPLDEKIAYGLPNPFLNKDPHKILNVAVTMFVERELRAIDPPVLSSDIESPELIYGQHKVINVNDVNAYKEFRIGEPSNQYLQMINMMQANMTAVSQGGDTKAVPSRQPDAARQVSADEAAKEQAMANTVTMYYDMKRQEMILVLKTMFQFYTADRYEKADKRTYRNISVPDQPLSLGGIGELKMRIVSSKQPDMDLFMEALKESKKNGHEVEIVEIPRSFLQNLEFVVTRIDLEPDNSDDIELANWVANVLNPMINVYVPAGVASIEKTFKRHLEKMGEAVADFAADKKPQGQPGQPGQPQQPGTQQGVPAPTGNGVQSVTGQMFGGVRTGAGR